MNIFKRPMFFAAVVCSVAAALSLYVKIFAYVFIVVSLFLIAAMLFYKKYNYLTVILTVFIFTLSLSFQFVKIQKINDYNNQNITNDFFIIVKDKNV